MSELLQLEHGMQAPAQARHWLADACRVWGCAELAPDAVLLVDELTTNAVLHAGTSVVVEADYDDLALWVSVSDRMPGDVSVAATTVGGERGRGLMIVDALANAWGVSPTPTGKSVWFALWTPSLSELRNRRGRLARWDPSAVPDSRARIRRLTHLMGPDTG